ncbi:MAG TPA: alkaline phosphatase family protein, partial [Solirubrobacterales bacterium]
MSLARRASLLTLALTGLIAIVFVGAAFADQGDSSRGLALGHPRGESPLPPGAIEHIMVIDIENEDEAATFGPDSPAHWLNETLVPKGELLENYYATGHVSADNYIAQVSGEAPNEVSGSDCISNFTTFAGSFEDVTPGTMDPDQKAYPGQVDGNGCVYPTSVKTIGNQLDEMYPPDPATGVAPWREYAEDMGNTPSRDHGEPDPLGGADCAHPAIGEVDVTNTATAADQYADRHNPFIYFHSVIDDKKLCDANVVPLGSVKVGGGPHGSDVFSGHLAQDLAHVWSTPRFGFITPNLCNDGHDATCAGLNAEGTHEGGLAGADAWLKHWVPMMMASPAYRSGKMLIVITSDESGSFATGGEGAAACCNEHPGPSWAWPGYAAILSLFGVPKPTEAGQFPGGGKIGALLLNPRWITPDTVDTTHYNHYSALRSYENLLGIDQGGTDGHGHLGFAA